MAWVLPPDLQNRIDAADPTGVPASAVVAAVLVILFLLVFSMAIKWSVDGIIPAEAAAVKE